MLRVVARRRRERGQGLTEFALVGPVLLALIFGVFDFGRGMSANVTVTNSAREGARYAALVATVGGRVGGSFPWLGCPKTTTSPITDPPATTAQGKAWRQLESASLDLSKVTMKMYFYSSSLNHDPSTTPKSGADDVITCNADGTVSESNAAGYNPSSGDWVQFETDYVYTPITPLITQFLKTVSMSQTATMVLE